LNRKDGKVEEGNEGEGWEKKKSEEVITREWETKSDGREGSGKREGEKFSGKV